MTGMLLSFAFGVRRLHRQGLVVAEIAEKLRVDEAAVLDAHLVLNLAVNDLDEAPAAPPRPYDDEMLDRMPKRIADRIRSARSQT